MPRNALPAFRPPLPSIFLLASFGKKLFRNRLIAPLIFTLLTLELLRPAPLFGEGHRLEHTAALILILCGLSLRAWGTGSAGTHTRSAEIEAPQLATGGPYAYLRNPIYAGSMVLGVGMSALIGDPLAFVLTGLVFSVLYLAIVPAEEEFLRSRFGSTYARYQQGVPRLIPRLTRWPESTPAAFHWGALRGECLIGLLLAGIYAALLAGQRLAPFWR